MPLRQGKQVNFTSLSNGEFSTEAGSEVLIPKHLA